MPFGFFVEVTGNRPDNELPGQQPGIDNSLPKPPPGVFPPPVISHPIVPIPPGTSVPPGTIWPPVNPDRPSNELPGGRPPRPDNTLPGSQPGVDNTLPQQPSRPDNSLPGSQTFWVVVWIPGYGWRYVAVDPSLTIDNSLPSGGTGNRPSNELPSAQPKT
jgi:hypothetical protein